MDNWDPELDAGLPNGCFYSLLSVIFWPYRLLWAILAGLFKFVFKGKWWLLKLIIVILLLEGLFVASR